MNSNEPPPTEATQALLKHQVLLSHAYAAFEAGTELAAQLLHRPGCFPDPHYYSHSVRYEAAKILRPLQQQFGFRLFIMGMTGLEVLSQGDRFRFWKATGEGEIPAAGDSPGRLDFIDQLQLPHIGEDGFHDLAKLLVLWDVDSHLSLCLFRLACPKLWESPWRSPESHWNTPIPHPASQIAGQDFGEEGSTDGLNLDETGDDEPDS